MGLDVSAQIIIGYQLKDLYTINKRSQTKELYDIYTGKPTGKREKIITTTLSRFDAKDITFGSDEDLEENLQELFEDICNIETGIDGKTYDIYIFDPHEDIERALYGIVAYTTGSHRHTEEFYKMICTHHLQSLRSQLSRNLKIEFEPDIFLFNDMSY